MTNFVHKPFDPVSEPINTSSQSQFDRGHAIDFVATYSDKVEELKKDLAKQEKILSAGTNDPNSTEPPFDKKQKKLIIRKIRKLKKQINKFSKPENSYDDKNPTDYYRMSRTQYDKFRKDVEKSFPIGLKRKYMVDEGLLKYNKKGQPRPVPDNVRGGKIDPRGGGTGYKRGGKPAIQKHIKKNFTEEEFILAKKHFARLQAAFCEVVTRYWELSPHISNPRVVVTSYSRGYPGQKADRGNHGYGIASDSMLECTYNGKKYIVPVLQYHNSIALLVNEGRLPQAKLGIYLNLGTKVAAAGDLTGGDPKNIPRPRGSTAGLTGAKIDQAGQTSTSGCCPGSSANVHYDFEGYFGVATVLGRKKSGNASRGGVFYIDMDLNGDGSDDLCSGRPVKESKYNVAPKKGYVARGLAPGPGSPWYASFAMTTLRSKNFNRKGVDNLKSVQNYLTRSESLFKKRNPRRYESKKVVYQTPFDNFLHEVDERVPNILQVLGVEGEDIVKKLGLDK